MDELLKKLLEAEVLTEETKTELEAAVKQQLEEALSQAKVEATATVTAQLNEQWITERDILIETLDEKVTEVLEHELAELKEDVERFRDLEAEYAEKLVEAKHELAAKLGEDLDELVQRIDAVVEIRLAEELEELKSDIEQTRKNMFGKKVFEAFAEEFKSFYTADDSLEVKLSETEQQLTDAMTALAEAETKNATLERAQKMRAVLAPLTGRTREVMEAVLKSVDTPLLEDAYKTYIGRILKESTAAPAEVDSEKETKVLAEKDESKDSQVVGIVKNGDDTAQLNESLDLAKRDEAASVVKTAISPEERIRLRRLAGLSQ